MIETVFALLLIVDHEIKEHRIQDSLSKCLKAKRYAMRDKKAGDRVVYKCIKSKANVEVYMGEKKITSLILE
jgi:Leu/Phe-tRNA-protein transferase